MLLSSKLAHFPLRIILTFLIVSELLIWLGPINYDISNSFILFLYLAILNLAFYMGYKHAVRNFRPSSYKLSGRSIKLLLLFGLFYAFLELIDLWGTRGLSVSNLLTNVIDALNNPGEAYYSEGDMEQNSYLTIILSPIKWIVIPLGIYSWDKLSKIYRYIALAIIVISAISWLGIGVRKGIFDLMVTILFIVLALKPQFILLAKWRRRITLYLGVSIIIFIVYFIYSNLSRAGFDSFDALVLMSTLDYRPFYLEFIPLPITTAIAFVTSYLCQGYYALALSLEIGILPLAPMGMSWFTIALAKKFDYDPTSDTYMHLLESNHNIDMSINWHSIYVWLANDFSFLGVPIVIYFVGYFLAQTWCDSVVGKNVWAFPIMTLFVIMSMYFFANNQVLSFSFIPLIVCFCIYQMSRSLRSGFSMKH